MTYATKFCVFVLPDGRACGNMVRTHETNNLGHPFTSGPAPADEPLRLLRPDPSESVQDRPESSGPSLIEVLADQGSEKHRGQLRMAQRLAAQHEGQLLHVHRMGWHVWDGTRWKPDDDGAPLRAVRDTIGQALVDLRYLPPDERDKLYKDISKSESASAMNGILTLAGADERLATAPARLDTHAHLLNCRNGTVDLRTGELRAHTPADMITKVAGCDFDWDAKGELFREFVEQVLPDAGTRDFVQRVLGQALCGTVTEHVLPILTGKGKNGKTTLIETVRSALGDYAMEAEPDLLLARESAHPTGLADLLGRRLVTCQETDEGRRLAAATVKRLTGGDRIRARRMRQDFFEFIPSHTVVMITNHKPRVSGDDDALWRRIRVVPFDFIPDRPDNTLPERLRADLPGVLAWLVLGYLDYVDKGLETPQDVSEATGRYRGDSDALGRFLQERAIANPQAHVRARELYHAWETWSKDAGEQPISEVEFANALDRRGITKTRRSIGYVYLGIGLYADSDQEAP